MRMTPRLASIFFFVCSISFDVLATLLVTNTDEMQCKSGRVYSGYSSRRYSLSCDRRSPGRKEKLSGNTTFVTKK